MPVLQRIHDTADTLEALAGGLIDEGRHRDSALFLKTARRLRALFAPGRRCPGRMWNGPGKQWTRCAVCGRLDYETNEGDACPYDIRPEEDA